MNNGGKELTLVMEREKRDAIARAYLQHIFKASPETIDHFASEPTMISDGVLTLTQQMSSMPSIPRPLPDKEGFWERVHGILGREYIDFTLNYRTYIGTAGENNFIWDVYIKNRNGHDELLRKITRH